ncbi:alpha/beta fold hydrolase [Salisediminibacterium halotolerans]|uniref:Pimeloyl-ACP methyl ester carboxylesterase n=1 Tax=Salisediminibacterium halotolerans TaxID=517425 RepID=A0A1H9Q3A5_9BACI|nr:MULTISPECIES: alpha/beta hydrolase [Salisediminibacterium]RLJ74237.1 pimeloyl-ACP methyl ester carboxylesterase [Actinophytocola xinjiangensis]RPE87671.1 pimeloyl-ACP methyl ester carboxylesterase [Salisediminibacterium halotolerans]TWG35074.1 pimeloyl-ACP methyl ester carboxylesterase [Salisediminibacterium halotolerans]SER54353.1 Pimeloyl-ACP methyl ester carboxylesterase [Salisediminibacterium haloalkalitolerans]GEL06878.1 alpha/beta hydrolase [Salisediminibacterium halotolerans]
MLHYHLYEKGPQYKWVTFIHGAGGSSSTWHKQVREFRKNFNVLLIDLRGHGRSSGIPWKRGDSFAEVADDVIDVLDEAGVKVSHFIGISLGTIVIQTLSHKYPERLESMILTGAVTHLNMRTKLLIKLGNTFKYMLPYMWLYRFFAWVIMPKKQHIESRSAFVDEAKKMCQKEFVRWFNIISTVNPFLKRLQSSFNGIPTLFVMGDDDHLFLPHVRALAENNQHLQFLCVEKSGHVCNIDQPERFNQLTIEYIHSLKRDDAHSV